jgi:mRNA interferase HicA
MPRLPICTPAEVERALLRTGFVLHHTRGSHRYYRNATTGNITAVAFHARDLKRGTLHGILKQAGLSLEAFLKLL